MTTANKLHWAQRGKRTIALTRKEASTLSGFRRSAYAAPIKEVMAKILDDVRLTNETEVSTEENRMRVKLAKELLDLVFDGTIELEA